MVDGPQFYDDDDIFNAYWQRRKKQDNPNDSLEKPIILELMGNVKYADILDLGCGDGDFGNLLIVMGCQSYTGIDASFNMVTLAKKSVISPKVSISYGRIENCDYPRDSYHLIVSRLTFHYIEDLTALFKRLHSSLKQGGQLIFSVEHPVMTSHNESLIENKGKRLDWLVDNYFRTGKRQVNWMGRTVTKYHRTLEDYFILFKDTGFRVLSLRESKPKRENFVSQDEFERRQRIPLFLFFALQKDSV